MPAPLSADQSLDSMERSNWVAEDWFEFAASIVYDAAGKIGDMAPNICQLVPGTRFAGPAFTVKCPVGDWSGAARALDLAQPGDVLVIDAGGTNRAVGWGGTASAFAQKRGIAAAVTNGAVRDLDAIREIAFPVYSAGASVRGSVRVHPGWIGIPVSVGDVVVKPGDIVIGDADGVVVVDAARRHEVLSRARELQARSLRMDADVGKAATYAELVGANAVQRKKEGE